MKNLLLLAMLGACGGDSIAIDSYPAERARAMCGKLFACCNAAEEMQLGTILGFTDEASCVAAFKADYDEELVEAKGAIAEGEITYNGESAADCVSQIADASCTEVSDDNSCDRIFRGKLANGTACDDDDLCNSGYCEFVNDVDGTCKSIPGEGEMCQTECSGNLVCGEGGTCIDRLPNGQACTSSRDCQSGFCNDMDVCTTSTSCDGND